MPTNLLYIGPLRPGALVLLGALTPAEYALFITPTAGGEQWEKVQDVFPNATQQVAKVAEVSGEFSYYEFNLPELNASQPASGLYTLYPGLELLRSTKQALLGVEALLAELETQKIDTCVVEQPELVWPLLQALASNQSYQHINILWLRVGTLPLYDGMPETAEILAWCQEHGFELQARNEDDPDLPLLQLARHAYYSRWQEETRRCTKLEKQLEAVYQELEQQQAQHTKEQAEHLKELKRWETESQKRQANSEEQLHQQKNQYEQLQQKYRKLQQQFSEQQVEVKQLTEAQEKLTNQSADDQQVKEAQIAELQNQLKQLTEERNTLKKQLNQSLKSSQQHQKEYEETKLQLEETQQKLLASVQQYQKADQAEQKAQKKIEESLAQLVTKKQALEESNGIATSLKTELEKQQAQIEGLQSSLVASDEEKENYQRYFTKRKKQHEEAEAQLAETQQILTDKDAKISQLGEQLAALQQSNERFGQLESKLESLFSDQRTYIQQTTSALGQHVTRNARQQRDEQVMINYLQHGQRPVNIKLAPRYVAALLEHYDTYNHDVVVIMGAMETTELVAQHIVNVRAEVSRIGKHGHRQEIHKEVTVSHDDLPQTIISIEHNKAACESLKESLNNKRLSPAVDVVYAPWVECQTFSGQAALFYAADTTLQRLNQWLPESARILVIVGETLPQAGHSREIVLPLLLQHLRTQQLDIVMEGNHFPLESELIAQWGDLLQTRQRAVEWLTLCTTYSLRVEG